MTPTQLEQIRIVKEKAALMSRCTIILTGEEALQLVHDILFVKCGGSTDALKSFFSTLGLALHTTDTDTAVDAMLSSLKELGHEFPAYMKPLLIHCCDELTKKQ